MPKLVKLTDEVGARLESLAQSNNVSMAKQVSLLLENQSATSVNDRLDKLGTYLETKFAELKHSIEDTTIDRISNPRRSTTPVTIEWEIFKSLWGEVLDAEGGWASKAVAEAYAQSDCAQDETYYIKDGQIWSEFMGVNAHPIVNLTPAVTQFLTEKGVL